MDRNTKSTCTLENIVCRCFFLHFLRNDFAVFIFCNQTLNPVIRI